MPSSCLHSFGEYTFDLQEPRILKHFYGGVQLPSTVQDAYKQHFGRVASADVLTFLRRELIHAVLTLVLFQPEFLEAYKDGILFRCTDNVVRRLFPRIMMYSADYPERHARFLILLKTISCSSRMLIATLRNLGQYPCASCLIRKEYIHLLGTKVDEQRRSHKRSDDDERREKVSKAREHIFKNGNAVDSAKVKGILNEGSLLPIHVSRFCLLLLLLLTVHTYTHVLSFFFRTLSQLSNQWVSITIRCLSRTSCTNSSSASGNLFLFIAFGYWLPKEVTPSQLLIPGEYYIQFPVQN